MTDSRMHQGRTRTRPSTPQERYAVHQNGSTGVRFDWRVAADHKLENRESEAGEISEADYFNELESPDHKGVACVIDKWSVSISIHPHLP